MLSLLLVPELLLLRDFVQEFIRSLPFSQVAEAGPSRAGARFSPGLSACLSGPLRGFSRYFSMELMVNQVLDLKRTF